VCPGPAPRPQARRIVSAITASSWRTCPKVNERRKVPSVEGAITRNGKTLWVAPARSRSAWSICEPPARIVVTKVSTLRPGRAPPTRPTSLTVALTSSSNPSRTINVAGTISPASATRLGSSKVTSMRSRPRDTALTESASFGRDETATRHRNFPSPGGTFRGCADLHCGYFIGGSRLRPSTLAQYGNVIELWLVPHLGSVKVATLAPRHVDELNIKLAKLSPRSRQLAVGCLKAACKWAADNGMPARSPIAGVQRPKVEPKPVAPWTVDEARKLLAATRKKRLGFAWALLLTRGLRRGELCGLRWEDVDLDAGVARIVRTRVVVDGVAVDSTPKTAAGKRTIDLDDMLVALLRSHKARQGAEKLAAGPAYQDAGYLTADELGTPVHPDTLSGWLDDEIKAAGVRRIRLHDLRHTAASLMLANGEQVKIVSEMLGHSSVTITLDIYAHVMPGMAKKAGAALSSALLS
jgi:integrase